MSSLAGCGGDKGQEKIVATAGQLTVTLADFHEAYNRITQAYRPDISTLEGRRDFANDLVNREILLAEGTRMGGITDPQIVQHLDGNRLQKMLGILYREQVASQIEVLGSDVAAYYEKSKERVKVSHILLEDVETARKVRADIVAGKISFEEAARRHSLDQSTKRKGGLLGQVRWSMTMPAHLARAFEMKAGELSDPVETEIGVHLIRLDERVAVELDSLEEERPALRRDVRTQLETLKMREYTAALERKAGLTWNEEGLGVLVEVLEQMRAAEIDTIPPALQFVPTPTPEQRTVVIARFLGRDWTIGDYTDYIAAQPTPNRPVSKLPYRGLKELIRTAQIDRELLTAEAIAQGIDKRAEVAEEDTRLREQILVELVHSRFIQAADVPEEDVRAVFDSTMAENEEALMLPERVDMYILTHSDENIVRVGIQRIRRGENEEDVIRELSLDPRTRQNGGRTGLIPRGTYAPQVEDVAFEGRAGKGWSEPVVTESGTGAVRVVTHEAPRLATFEEMLDPLTRQLALARGEEAFEAWLQAERESRGIEIHDEVLELIGQSVS